MISEILHALPEIIFLLACFFGGYLFVWGLINGRILVFWIRSNIFHWIKSLLDVVARTVNQLSDAALPISLTDDGVEKDICPICLEPLSEKSFREPGCGHRFHHDCRNKWARVARTCPMCRRPLLTNRWSRHGSAAAHISLPPTTHKVVAAMKAHSSSKLQILPYQRTCTFTRILFPPNPPSPHFFLCPLHSSLMLTALSGNEPLQNLSVPLNSVFRIWKSSRSSVQLRVGKGIHAKRLKFQLGLQRKKVGPWQGCGVRATGSRTKTVGVLLKPKK